MHWTQIVSSLSPCSVRRNAYPQLKQLCFKRIDGLTRSSFQLNDSYLHINPTACVDCSLKILTHGCLHLLPNVINQNDTLYKIQLEGWDVLTCTIIIHGPPLMNETKHIHRIDCLVNNSRKCLPATRDAR